MRVLQLGNDVVLLADIQFFSAYSRLVTTDEDNKRLKTEVSEMKARHRLEIERVTREKEQEMEEVHKRLVNCLRRKDHVVGGLNSAERET